MSAVTYAIALASPVAALLAVYGLVKLDQRSSSEGDGGDDS